MSDFSTETAIDTTVFNQNIGSPAPATFDDANNQIDYVHNTPTGTKRFLNHDQPSGMRLFESTQGYFKTSISNFTGVGSIWFGFVEDNAANNHNYLVSEIDGNGTYELVFNNATSGSISFNNGAGWSGTLAAREARVTTDGGATDAALPSGFQGFGAQVDSGNNLIGFGFANFGNAGTFPSSSFSIDSLEVHDLASVSSVPEPTTMLMFGVACVSTIARRRKRAS